MQKSIVEFLHQLYVHCKQNKNQHIKIKNEFQNGFKLKSTFPTDKYKTKHL